MKIKVLLITQWFDPEPTFKGMLFAKSLVAKGFEVEVLTGFPNYPFGKVYYGFKIRLLDKKLIEGVTVTRLPLYPSHNSSVIKRTLNYISFAASTSIYGIFFAKKPNIIYAYHPPITVGIAAALIKFFRRVPLIYDVQDLWPDTLKATRMINNDNVLRLIGKICARVYRSATHLVVLSPGFKALLITRGISENKIDLIYNWADESKIQNSAGVLPTCFPSEDKFKIIFAGNIGSAQALDIVLQACQILEKMHSCIHFVIVGDGIALAGLKDQANVMKLSNLTFIPSVPMSEVGTILNAADVLLVHLNTDPLFEITIPSKTQAYMVAGKPILMGVKGDASELIISAKCGLVFEPQNAFDLVKNAEALATIPRSELLKMGENARKFYMRHLSVEVGVSKFAKIINEKATLTT